MRRRVLGHRVRAASARCLGAAELRKLNRIGVNLNQMTRTMNSGAVSVSATNCYCSQLTLKRCGLPE